MISTLKMESILGLKRAILSLSGLAIFGNYLMKVVGPKETFFAVKEEFSFVTFLATLMQIEKSALDVNTRRQTNFCWNASQN